MAKSADTRNEVKLAARRLFARRGIDGVSIREIVKAAGQRNVGLLHYYFGTKEALVRELVVDGAKLIDERRNARLAELEAAGGPHDLREVLDILVYPSIGLAEDEGEDSYTRFISGLQVNHRDIFLAALENKWNSGYQRCLAHIRRLLPHLPEALLNQRLIFMSLFLQATLSAREAALERRSARHRFWHEPHTLEHLIDVMRGMLEAPLSPQTRARSATPAPLPAPRGPGRTARAR